MKKIVCLRIVLSSITLPQILYGQDKQINLDTLVKKLGEKFMTDKQAVGLSIGVYTRGTGYFYNFGTTTKNNTILPTQNTVYEIGSITKTLVSFILANAVLENKVSLD